MTETRRQPNHRMKPTAGVGLEQRAGMAFAHRGLARR